MSALWSLGLLSTLGSTDEDVRRAHSDHGGKEDEHVWRGCYTRSSALRWFS